MGNIQSPKKEYSLSTYQMICKLLDANKDEFLSGTLEIDWDAYYQGFTLFQHWIAFAYQLDEKKYQPISDYIVSTQNYDLRKKCKKNLTIVIGEKKLPVSEINGLQLLDKLRGLKGEFIGYSYWDIYNQRYFSYDSGQKNLKYLNGLIKSFRRYPLRKLQEKYQYQNHDQNNKSNPNQKVIPFADILALPPNPPPTVPAGEKPKQKLYGGLTQSELVTYYQGGGLPGDPVENSFENKKTTLKYKKLGKIKKIKRIILPPSLPPPSAPPLPPPLPSRAPPPIPQLNPPPSVENDTSDLSTCVICLDQPRNTLILPCKHNCLCQECAVSTLIRCPICRTPDITFLTYINS